MISFIMYSISSTLISFLLVFDLQFIGRTNLSSESNNMLLYISIPFFFLKVIEIILQVRRMRKSSSVYYFLMANHIIFIIGLQTFSSFSTCYQFTTMAKSIYSYEIILQLSKITSKQVHYYIMLTALFLTTLVETFLFENQFDSWISFIIFFLIFCLLCYSQKGTSDQRKDFQMMRCLSPREQDINISEKQNQKSIDILETERIKQHQQRRKSNNSYIDSKFLRFQSQTQDVNLYKTLWSYLPQGIVLFNCKEQLIYYNSKVENLLECEGKIDVQKKLNEHLNTHIIFENTENEQSSSRTNKRRMTYKQKQCQEQIQLIYSRRSRRSFSQDDLVTKSQMISLIIAQLEKERIDNFEEQYPEFIQLKVQFYSILKSEEKTLRFRISLIRNFEVDDEKYLFIIIDNITKKKNFDNLKKKYEFEISLISSFSHELKTPLNATLQLLDGCRELVNEDILQGYIHPIQIQNQLLLYQINDILDFSSIQQNQFMIKQRMTTFEEILTELNFLFQDSFQNKNQIFLIECEEDIQQKEFNNDKDRIMQILINLINNSQKFTPNNGKILLNIFENGNANYIFKLTDTGIGIQNLQLEAINYYLTTGKPSIINQKYIGLGLKVSDKIAKHLNKDQEGLTISSSHQGGTVIQFKIEDFRENIQTPVFVIENYENLQFNTLDSIEEMAKRAVPKQQSSINNMTQLKHKYQNGNEKKFKSLNIQSRNRSSRSLELTPVLQQKSIQFECSCIKILLVDDIPFNHIAFKGLLKGQIQFDSAYDGYEAIEKVKSKSKSNCCCFYKIILMDIEMPGMDGYQCSKNIISFLEDLMISPESFKVIMCSAYNTQDVVLKARKMGMHLTLPKPIESSKLAQILNEYLYQG